MNDNKHFLDNENNSLKSQLLNQNFNYHNHCPFFETEDIESILQELKKNGIKIVGFSEVIPNPSMILPSDKNKILLSELDEYISSIRKLNESNQDITILVGFEAEYNPMKEKFLKEIRDKVDYMILKQHFVNRGLQNVPTENNPDYPIIYANMITHALKSGIFDIITNPDYFMKFKDTMKSEENKTLFEDNAIIASQIICEKATEMGVTIEIPLNKISSENFNPLFWKIAKDIEGLQIIKGIDIYDLNDIKKINESNIVVSEIEKLVGDKLIKSNYNPKVARSNNKLLLMAYNHNDDALSYESNMISQILFNGTLTFPSDLSSDDILFGIIEILDNVSINSSKEVQKMEEELEKQITFAKNENNKKQIERLTKILNEVKRIASYQQMLISNTKQNAKNAKDLGCQIKEEYLNIITQLTEYSTTKNEEHKSQIQKHILDFQKSKQSNGGLQEELGETRKLLNPNVNNSGSINLGLMFIIITILIILSICFGYMLYRLNLG